MSSQVFQIAPGSVRALWIIAPVLVIPVLIGAVVLVATLTGMKKARFEVSDAGLRLTGDLYGRTIPASDLRGGAAHRININETGDLQPVRRTLGTGLPGYRAGWFRLRNGEKALLYVTDATKVVYIPTRLDYSVLLSPEDPEGLLNAIRTLAPAP
jgi:hypothetical protein